MNNKEYLSEEKYQKTRKVLITIGCVSLLIALVFLILAIVLKKELLVPGAFVFGLMIPIPLFLFAFARNIAAFNMQLNMPVAKETAEKMAPTAGKVAKEVTKGVKEGLKEEEKDK